MELQCRRSERWEDPEFKTHEVHASKRSLPKPAAITLSMRAASMLQSGTSIQPDQQKCNLPFAGFLKMPVPEENKISHVAVLQYHNKLEKS